MSKKKGSAPCWTTALGFQAMTQCRSFKLSSSKPAEAAFPTRSASWRRRLPVPEGWPSIRGLPSARLVVPTSHAAPQGFGVLSLQVLTKDFPPVCVWGARWSCIKVAKCCSIMTLGGTVGVINGYSHVYNHKSWDIIPTTNMVPYHLIIGHLQVGIYIYICISKIHTHIYIYICMYMYRYKQIYI